jgi:hypothetical protein
VLFFCEREPTTDGETPVLDSTRLFDDLSGAFPAFVAALEAHGVQYMRTMSAEDRPHSAIGRGWRATFDARTRAEAEAALSAKGYTWEWLSTTAPSAAAEDGAEDALLREVSPRLDAVRAVGGRKALFNQLIAVWLGWADEFNRPETSVRLGNGAPLDALAMSSLIGLASAHSVAVPWQRGDILLLNNLTVQHSRRSFTGPRRILASLTK